MEYLELDTGASVSVICEKTYEMICKESAADPLLQQTDVKLKTYTGEAITLLGKVPVKVSYGNHEGDLTVQVVAGEGPDLFGRD